MRQPAANTPVPEPRTQSFVATPRKNSRMARPRSLAWLPENQAGGQQGQGKNWLPVRHRKLHEFRWTDFIFPALIGKPAHCESPRVNIFLCFDRDPIIVQITAIGPPAVNQLNSLFSWVPGARIRSSSSLNFFRWNIFSISKTFFKFLAGLSVDSVPSPAGGGGGCPVGRHASLFQRPLPGRVGGHALGDLVLTPVKPAPWRWTRTRARCSWC